MANSTTMDDPGFKMEKLNPNNYHSWKFTMRMYLIGKDLWDIVQGTETPVESASADIQRQLKKKENIALAAICLNVSPNLHIYIRSVKTAKEAWDCLAKHFEGKSLAKKILYRRKLYSARMEQGTTMISHVNYIKTLAEHLEALEDEVSDMDLVIILLSSLPESYNHVITTLETIAEDKLKWDYVRDRLLQEYDRKQGSHSHSDSYKHSDGEALFSRKGNRGRYGGYVNNKGRGGGRNNLNLNKDGKNSFKCHFCGEKGHFARECPKKDHKPGGKANVAKTDVGEPVNIIPEFALEGEAVIPTENVSKNEINDWWIDSGASQHMTAYKDTMLSYKSFEKPFQVKLADDSILLAYGKGNIIVPIYNGCEKINIMLQDVWYVPKIQNQLVSLPAMIAKGADVHFKGSKCLITINKREYEVGHKHGKLFKLNLVPEATCCFLSNIPSYLWHLRYGHVGYDSLKLLTDKNMVNGMNFNSKCDSIDKHCEPCIFGKQQRLPFPKNSNSKTTKPLELVHTDVSVMNVKSIGGSKYFVTFIDDFSRFFTVYMLKSKDEVFLRFKEFLKMAENLTGQKLKRLRSDNGGEYVSVEFSQFLKSNGIAKDVTIPYTPQQNGVAERANRTLLELARSMLFHAKLPDVFWAEAVATATYIRNRSPTSCFEGETPYERWYKCKPDVGHMKVFGCTAYVHVPKEKRLKLDVKSSKCIFVGYPIGSKGYKVYDPVTQKMFRSRDVIFVEDDFSTYDDDTAEKRCKNGCLNEKPYYIGPGETPFNDNEVPEIIDDINTVALDVPDVEVVITDNPENNGDVELVDPVVEEVFADPVDRPRRNRQAPNRFGDWEYASVAISGNEDPRSYTEAMRSPDADEWKKATDIEIKSLKKNKTWELTTLPKNKKVIGCKWVMKTKRDAQGDICRYKARLVAQGFSQKYGVDYDEVFAPVVKYVSIRCVLALANKFDMEIHQMDVKSAYLNSDIDTNIYMKQPTGYIDSKNPELVCKLKKSIYGLKQSARCWNKLIDEYLKSEGYVQNKADPCIYVKSIIQENKKILAIITLYVDDTIICCNDIDYLREEKLKISSRFEMEDQGEIHYLLGMSIKRDRANKILTIDQKLYLEGVLKRFGMANCNPVSTPMENGKRFQALANDDGGVDINEYQAVIGSLIYASIATRPDISAAVGVLSKFMVKPGTDHWIGVKRILRYLKGTLSYGLVFSHSQSDDFSLHGYSDADWAGDIDTRKSTSGYIFRLGPSTISWRSNKQSIVALSTTEAEYVALCQAVQEAVWLRNLLSSLYFMQNGPTVIFEDNQSTISLSNSLCSISNSRLKHVEIKFHYVKDIIKRNIVKLQYCPTNEMIGDVFTKGLARPAFEKFRKGMGVDIIQ